MAVFFYILQEIFEEIRQNMVLFSVDSKILEAGMRIKWVALGITLFVFFTSACSKGSMAVMSKREVHSYSEKTLKAETPVDIDLDCDNATIEIYTWKKNEIKFEMTKIIRGQEEKEKLEERMKNFTIKFNRENSRISFTSVYKALFGSSVETYLKLKLYFPKKMNLITCELNSGNLRIFDDIRCDLNVTVNKANVEINRLDGCIQLKGNTGNVRIGSGKLKGNSCITGKNGNISIKAELDEAGEYKFETEVGNIDLDLPGESRICLESEGTVERNELSSHPAGTKIYTKSRLGRISIRK